ncbi:MAG TPA: glycine dehydrogenase (aminomethyl-transferring), partial [Candidatus Dormibacteraeota bacterium]|nr:glycine dehydrogenase (aminomethyl-transferring) [Candidatus Dormibacteraeota bacterium]
FQSMIIDLTGMQIANASLLDEATAAAEAVAMCHGIKNPAETRPCWVSDSCHPQTIAVIRTRAEALGIPLIIGRHHTFDFGQKPFAVVLQYPATDGTIHDYQALIDQAHAHDALAIVAADPLSLTLLKPPGEFGADVVVGSSQRFGVPLGYGGPHAAFFATRDAFKRHMPGRLVGVSKDAQGRPALRLTLQTREQHIRREKATSNICTAQVLLAVIASMYAVYHGPEGLRKIARRVHRMTVLLAQALSKLGLSVTTERFFDTVQVNLGARITRDLMKTAEAHRVNLRVIDAQNVGITLDETHGIDDLETLLKVFAGEGAAAAQVKTLLAASGDHDYVDAELESALTRTSPFLTHPVFNRYHSETEMLRYIRKLESRDLSLTASMIPLGSCTMKLNATAEMFPVTWPEFGRLHPFAPTPQAEGYKQIF